MSGSSRPRTTTYVEDSGSTSSSSKWAAVEGSGVVGASGRSTEGAGGAAGAGTGSSVSSTNIPSNRYIPKGQKDMKVMTVIASHGYNSGLVERSTSVSYKDTKVIGNGSFGVVYQARLCATDELVAIKKVLQDKRFKNRELQIMRRLEHCNIVKLLYFFYTCGDKKDEIYLNLVLEYIPETVYKVARQYSKSKQIIPIFYIKLYMYQLFRSLSFIHRQGICHRDIKPQNLLLDQESGILKLCDFGSAKHLIRGEPNVSYICSRYYRAPELIFGAVDYTTNIDVWSAGCVFAELILGQPIFPGDSGVDQLVEIIKVLGTPTREQIKEMNPNYTEFKFPQIKAHPWQKVFRARTSPEAIDLVSRLLEYTPAARIRALEACVHTFFDELREPGTKLPSGRSLPPLFNFQKSELSMPSLNSKLIPPHVAAANAAAAAASSEASGAAASGESGASEAPASSAGDESKATKSSSSSSLPTSVPPAGSAGGASAANEGATASSSSAAASANAASSATKDDSMNQGSPTGGNS